MKVVLAPIGSQGDVTPLIALGVRLREAGHVVRLVCGDDVTAQATAAGIRSRSIGRDVRRAMSDHRDLFAFGRRLSPAVTDAVMAEDGADAVVSTFLGAAAGQVARRRGIPYFYAASLPGLPTQEFAYPTAAPKQRSTRANLGTHLRMARVARMAFPAARTLFDQPRPTYLHCFSEHVVPRPADWGSFAHVTGYWFADSTTDHTPDPALARFLANGPPPVAITFGGTIDRDPRALTATILTALRTAGRRAVLVSDRMDLTSDDLPDTVTVVPTAPLDWLFSQVSTVVHHGGAGTTALALRAGLPQVVIPFTLDQPFWADRMHTLGAAPPPIPRKKLTADRLAETLTLDTTDMRRSAQHLSSLIATEDGTGAAVRIIEQVVATSP